MARYQAPVKIERFAQKNNISRAGRFEIQNVRLYYYLFKSRSERLQELAKGYGWLRRVSFVSIVSQLYLGPCGIEGRSHGWRSAQRHGRRVWQRNPLVSQGPRFSWLDENKRNPYETTHALVTSAKFQTPQTAFQPPKTAL